MTEITEREQGKYERDSKGAPPLPTRTSRLKHHFYTKLDLSGIDKRTKLGRSIKALRRELREYVGEPSIGSEILIQRIIFKVIKLAQYEMVSLVNAYTDEAQHYLPMANSLRLDIQALQKMAGNKSKTPDLSRYLNKLKEASK